MLIVDHPAVLSGLSDLGLNFSDISGDSGIPVSLYLTMIYYQLMGCVVCVTCIYPGPTPIMQSS